jgi:hypothetical protein
VRISFILTLKYGSRKELNDRCLTLLCIFSALATVLDLFYTILSLILQMNLQGSYNNCSLTVHQHPKYCSPL